MCEKKTLSLATFCVDNSPMRQSQWWTSVATVHQQLVKDGHDVSWSMVRRFIGRSQGPETACSLCGGEDR